MGLTPSDLLIVTLVVTFAVAIWRGHHSVIDVTWGLGFVVVALTSLLVSSGHGDVTRRVLIAALTAAWGLRLAFHIAAPVAV